MENLSHLYQIMAASFDNHSLIFYKTSSFINQELISLIQEFFLNRSLVVKDVLICKIMDIDAGGVNYSINLLLINVNTLK